MNLNFHYEISADEKLFCMDLENIFQKVRSILYNSDSSIIEFFKKSEIDIESNNIINFSKFISICKKKFFLSSEEAKVLCKFLGHNNLIEWNSFLKMFEKTTLKIEDTLSLKDMVNISTNLLEEIENIEFEKTGINKKDLFEKTILLKYLKPQNHPLLLYILVL